MNDCMWMLVIDNSPVCIPTEPSLDGKLSACELKDGCGYQRRVTAEDYRNAPRIMRGKVEGDEHAI